ncbi:hypothetical protein OIU74_015349 [Salix koriyanagi]|uniref:Uncharacterized protein n=1 Tax=Salix koriyanagi TaxID=2511006 RepID=A0A9Q0T0R6_9ROSI|nr:hypothetical protein OIU74_015349 [Salix koriyanagi]
MVENSRHKLFTANSHQKLALANYLTSNISFPLHLCYSKAFLQLG